MLKRFMTWLLNKIQKILGMISGKRNSDRTAISVEATSVRSKSAYSSPAAIEDMSDISVAERSPLVSASATTPSGVADTLPHRAVEDAANTYQSVDVASSDEVTIRKRLDVASSSVAGVENLQPRFPVEVSELLADSNSKSDDSPPYMQSAKSIVDEQLPLVQDLLPAVASDQNSNIAEGNTADDEERDISKSPKDLPPVAKSVQPVLFSFDITESEDGLEKGGSSLEQSIELSSSIETLDDDNLSAKVDVDIVDVDIDVAINLQNADGLEAASKLSLSNRTLNDARDKKSKYEATDAENVVVPKMNFPEKTATPISVQDSYSEDSADIPQHTTLLSQAQDNETSLTTDDSLKQSFHSVDSEDHEDSPQNNYPIKNGTVKLLFTLKEGNFHGYIAPDDGSKDILFHQKYINGDIFPQLERGIKVSASVKHIEGKAYATHIELL